MFGEWQEDDEPCPTCRRMQWLGERDGLPVFACGNCGRARVYDGILEHVAKHMQALREIDETLKQNQAEMRAYDALVATSARGQTQLC